MWKTLFNRLPTVRLNVLLYEEENEWVAHCLQMDILTTARDRATVERDIVDLIKAQTIYAIENENTANLFKSAPEEDWERLTQAHRCGTRKIVIKAPKQDHEKSKSLPIREIELCLA